MQLNFERKLVDPNVNLLVVDDDQISVMAIKRALKKLGIVNPVVVAVDGQEALDILRGSSAHSAIDRPYLVTLDINMPRMNGHEFLAEVRKDPSLKNAIIFVLTTSDAPEDIARAYSQNVAGYIVKDDLQDSFVNALRLLDAYSETVALPH